MESNGILPIHRLSVYLKWNDLCQKTGNAVLMGTLGDLQLGCVVSVVTPARKRTVQKAIQIAKTCTYSQPKRMQEKFYDCSSLVWKSYHKNGVNLEWHIMHRLQRIWEMVRTA